MAKKHIIWESNPLLTEEEVEGLRAEYPELLEDASEWEVRDFFDEMNQHSLEDERMNLDVPVAGDILVIADLGFWNGRKSGYKVLEAKNVSEVLRSYVDGNSEITFFSDGYNLRAEESHHDATNTYLFREIRDGVNIGNLLARIYDGKEISSSMLCRYTKSLHPYAAKVYGWPCRQKLSA